MRMPAGFDKCAASLRFEPLELGGHVCKIIKAEEATSKKGDPMLRIDLDIAEGPQADYYKKKFDNDDREKKRWGCTTYVVLEINGECTRNCASFVTSVEESSPGFLFPWENADKLKGRKVGAVFGEEEYLGNDGKVRKSTKPFWWRSIQTVKDAPVPQVKAYKPKANQFSSISPDDIPFF